MRQASTVLVVRRTPGGREVLMVRRSRRSGFLPDAWVFPGGRVDEADYRTDTLGWLVPPDLDLVERAHRAAALRETFEEAGLWLGPLSPPAEARAQLARGEVSLAALLAEGARADLSQLLPFARWQTPVVEPKRFDTRFYLVEVDEAPEVTPDGQETVEARWVRPEEAAAATLRAFPVAPPTWWTLTQLARGLTPNEVDRLPVLPILRIEPEATWLLMPGHPDHPDPARPGWPIRIDFREGRWVASPPG